MAWVVEGSLFARPCKNCGNNDAKKISAIDYTNADDEVVKMTWKCEKCEYEWLRGEGELQ